MFTSVKNAVHSTYLHVADKMISTMTESCFLEKGMLTPEEFVAAGDLLVYKCRTWTWEAGDPSKAVPYLPKDKQFLMTRNIKCTGSAEEELSSTNTTFNDGGDDDEWVTAAASAASKASDDIDDAAVVEDAAAAPKAKPAATQAPVKLSDIAYDEDDDYDDDDDDDVGFVDDDDDDAIAAAPAKKKEDDVKAEPAKKEEETKKENAIVKTRTYDLSITYDHYYRTPRAWLYGYDEQMKPLTPQQIFEDISGSHAHKTVTMDAHPHLGIQEAYIHPCKHAEVMKKMIDRQIDLGKTPRVDQYMILFVKFLASVIPSLDYDFTLDVE